MTLLALLSASANVPKIPKMPQVGGDDVQSGAVDRTLLHAYDARGRLQRVNPDSQTADAAYAYDAVGNLAALTFRNGVSNTYPYNERNWLRLVDSRRGGTQVAQYGYDGAAPGATGWTGHLQIAITEPNLNYYRYTAQQRDPDLGLYYLRARYYRPELGRFWTMDSYEGSQIDPLSLHNYLSAADNPVNMVDPSGNLCEVQVMAATTLSVGLSVWATAAIAKTGAAIKQGMDVQGLAQRLRVQGKVNRFESGVSMLKFACIYPAWGVLQAGL